MVARNIVLGCVAGMLSVLVFHQGMYYLLAMGGLVAGGPWRLNPAPFWRDLSTVFGAPIATVPLLMGLVVWGGLWGGLFGLFADWIPARRIWLKGMIFALIFPLLLGSWLIIPMIRGATVFSGYFFDYNPVRLTNGVLLLGAFGLGLGFIYALYTRRLDRARPHAIMDVELWHVAGNIKLDASCNRRKDDLSATQGAIAAISRQIMDQSISRSIPTHFVRRQKPTVSWQLFVSILIVILLADMAFRIWALIFILPYGYHGKTLVTFTGLIVAQILGTWLIYQFLWRPMYRSASSALNSRLAISAGEAVIKDNRPPVILLRGFGSDSVRVKVGVLDKCRLEEVIALDMDSVGPFIAVGQPKERNPHLGAARDYIPDDKWQLTVEKWVQLASVVVVIASDTPGLVWELDRIGQLHCEHKVILINPRSALVGSEGIFTIAERIWGRAAIASIANQDLDRSLVLHLTSAGGVRTIGSPSETGQEYQFALALAMLSLLGRPPSSALLA